jgi:hypothetical protein
VHARAAREAGVKLVVSTDAHQVESLEFARYGIGQARRAWCTAGDVANTRGWAELDVNLWRVHLAALDCDADEVVVPLLRADWADFRGDGDGGYRLSVPLEPAWLAAHGRYLDERGRLAHGTSLWFENVVGQVARPDRLDFAVAAVREPELETAAG